MANNPWTFLSQVWWRALSDDVIDELSCRLSKDDMDRLAPELGISSEEVNKIFAKHCPEREPTQKANREIILKWRNRQNSREEAYHLLGEALIRGDLKLIAREVLKYPPDMNGSKGLSAAHDNERSSPKRPRKEL